MNVTTSIQQLITQKWSTDMKIKKFYQQYKNTKMTIEEVAEQPQLKVTLISIFLYTVQNSFSEFALNIKWELLHLSTLLKQKTFEHIFTQFWNKHQKHQTHYESLIKAMKQMKKCSVCERNYKKVCWVRNSEQALTNLKKFFQKKNTEWQQKQPPLVIEAIHSWQLVDDWQSALWIQLHEAEEKCCGVWTVQPFCIYFFVASSLWAFNHSSHQ